MNMNVERTKEALEIYTYPASERPYMQALVDAAKFALEVMGADCAQWEEGVCGGRLVGGLCGTHQPVELIPVPFPIYEPEHMKELT